MINEVFEISLIQDKKHVELDDSFAKQYKSW